MEARAIPDLPDCLRNLGKQLVCPICLSLCKMAVSLPCNHAFCSACISESLKSSSSCPVCKARATRREMRPAPNVDRMVLSYARIEGATGLHLIASQIPPDTDDENDAPEEEEVIPESPDPRTQYPVNKAGFTSSPFQDKQRFRWIDLDERELPWKCRPCNNTVGGPDTPYRSSDFRSFMPPRKRDRWPANLGVKRVNNDTVEDIENDDVVEELGTRDAKKKMHSDGGAHESAKCSMNSPAMASPYLNERERLLDRRRGSAQRSLDWGEDKLEMRDGGDASKQSHPGGRSQSEAHQCPAVYYGRSDSSMDTAKLPGAVPVAAGIEQKWVCSPVIYPQMFKDSVSEWEEREREILLSGVRVCPPCPKRSFRPLFWASDDADASDEEEVQVPLTQPSPGMKAKSATFRNAMGFKSGKEACLEPCAQSGEQLPMAALQKVERAADHQPVLRTPLKSEENVSKTFVKRNEGDLFRNDACSEGNGRVQRRMKPLTVDARLVGEGDDLPSEAAVAAGDDGGRWESSGRVGKIRNWLNRRSRSGSAGGVSAVAAASEHRETVDSAGERREGDLLDSSGAAAGNSENNPSTRVESKAQRMQEETEGRENEGSAAMRQDNFNEGCSLRTPAVPKEGVEDNPFCGGCIRGAIVNGDICGVQDKKCEERDGDGDAQRESEFPVANWGVGKRGRLGKMKSESGKTIVNTDNGTACPRGEGKELGGASPPDNPCGNGGREYRCNNSSVGKTCENTAPGCAFCGQAGKSPVAGALLFHKTSRQCWRSSFSKQDDDDEAGIPGVYVHRLCATWAPNVYYKGVEFCNLEAELNRSRRIRCASCLKPGAALGCFLQKCPKSYHYECAFSSSGSRFDKSHFVMFCPEHGGMSFPWESKEKIKKDGRKDTISSAKEKNDMETDKESKGTALKSHERPLKRKRLQELEATKLETDLDNTRNPCSESSLASAQSLPLSSRTTGASLSQSEQRIVLCCSGLGPREKELAQKVVAMTGIGFVKQWSPAVTHLVANINSRKRAKRTLKFMFAVLHGQWVLSPQWLAACREAGRPVAEESFEVIGELHGTTGGPSQGRNRRLNKSPPLFHGYSFYLFGEFFEPSKSDISQIVEAGEGTVLAQEPQPEEWQSQNSADAGSIGLQKIMIVYNGVVMPNQPRRQSLDGAVGLQAFCQPGVNTMPPAVLRWKGAEALAHSIGAKAVVVSHMWLLDSASMCQLRETALYSGPPCPRRH